MELSGHNLSNGEVNAEYLQHRKFKRVGSCKDCNGRCCNVVVLGLQEHTRDYFGMHGIQMRDRWIPHLEYVVIPAHCQQCVGGLCQVFNSKVMPEACRQFPISPWDMLWRYLKQIGTPCGMDFVDRETGKPWDMRRTFEKWGT